MHIITPSEIERQALAQGLSVYALCKKANIAGSTFSRAKAGETKLSGNTLEKLAKVLQDGPKNPGSVEA